MRVQRTVPAPTREEELKKEVNLELLKPIIEKYKNKKGNLIPLLQGTQELYGYVPEDAFYIISEATGLELSTIYGVATFYAQFRLKPVGKNIIKVCHGTACHVQDAKKLSIELREILKIEDGETTKDGLFTLESVACLGCCSLAPVMMVGDETYGKLTGKSAGKIVKQIRREEKNKK